MLAAKPARFTTDRNPGARGRARIVELAATNKAEIEELITHLVRSLGRPATAGERVEAELIATGVIHVRRLGERCRDSSKERRILRDLMKSTVFGSVPAPSPAEIQHGSAVTNVVGPKAPGKTYFVAEKGGDPAPDGATAPDEVSSNAV